MPIVRSAAVMLALLVTTTSGARAQYSSMSTGQSVQGSGAGPVHQNFSCSAGVDHPDRVPLYMNLKLILDGWVVLADRYKSGIGTVSDSASASVEIGKQNMLIECFLYEYNYGVYDNRSYTIQGRRPTSQYSIGTSFSYWGFGNYHRNVTFQVQDNYGFGYGYTDAEVWESFSYGSNGCNITVNTNPGAVYLTSSGTFQDNYTTGGQPIPACAVAPSCVTYTTQTHTVEAQPFSHSVVWSCTNVEVNR